MIDEQIESRVGMRIRTLRKKRGLSLRALSALCGLSINAISQIERGESSPTLSSLHVLATALGVPLTTFLEDDSEQAVVFLKQAERQRSRGEGFVMEGLGAGLPNQQLEPFLVTIEAGRGNTASPITHPGEELVYCLTGELEYRIGSTVYRLEAGDSLLFQASQPHGFCNPATTSATLLLVFLSGEASDLARQRHLDA